MEPTESGVDPELSTGGGTSDGRFIAPAGVDVVELGPVNKSIHKINEHIALADVPRLSVMYEKILERYFRQLAEEQLAIEEPPPFPAPDNPPSP